MARDRNKDTVSETIPPVEGVVIDQPAAETPATPKPKNTGDPELKAIGRLTRYLNGLPIRARRRVATYLADRIADDAQEG